MLGPQGKVARWGHCHHHHPLYRYKLSPETSLAMPKGNTWKAAILGSVDLGCPMPEPGSQPAGSIFNQIYLKEKESIRAQTESWAHVQLGARRHHRRAEPHDRGGD